MNQKKKKRVLKLKPLWRNQKISWRRDFKSSSAEEEEEEEEEEIETEK